MRCSGLSAVAAWAAQHSERWPQVNSKEMWRAVLVLLSADVIRTMALAGGLGTQVTGHIFWGCAWISPLLGRVDSFVRLRRLFAFHFVSYLT